MPHPEEAFTQLSRRLPTIGTQTVALSNAAGRILAEPVRADRPSPPYDCSAMDGFAVCLEQLEHTGLPVSGEARMGQPPPVLKSGTAIRISTGSPIPHGADTVVPVESVREQAGRMALITGVQPQIGQNIRRCGENAGAGSIVLNGGVFLRPGGIAALAAFAKGQVRVHRRLRVVIITTGDELAPLGRPLTPWHIADSNSPALTAAISLEPWLQCVKVCRMPDDPAAMTAELPQLFGQAEVILTTGGVSKGHRDFIPDVIKSVGGEIIFHRLPIRPGGPVLGAIVNGKPLFALPGNPVSILVLWRRFVLPGLALYAGCWQNMGATSSMELTTPLDKPHEKWNYRVVRVVGMGKAELPACQGSGDIPAAAISDGIIEIEPKKSGCGPFPFFSWSAL